MVLKYSMEHVGNECNPCYEALFYDNIYMSMDNLLCNFTFSQGLMKVTLLI